MSCPVLGTKRSGAAKKGGRVGRGKFVVANGKVGGAAGEEGGFN